MNPLPVTVTGKELAQRVAKAAHDARGADAPATIRTYAYGVRAYVSWCDETGTPYALPVDPEALARFIDDRSGVLAPATVSAYVSAIDRMHRDLDLPPPGACQVVKLAKRRMRRVNAKPQKQATPMRWDDVSAALDQLGGSLIDLRDAALLALAFDTMCRASELAGLNVSDIRNQGGAFSAFIAKSKTDQDGEGAFAYVSPATHHRLLVWIDAARLERDSALFIPLSAVDKPSDADRISARDVSRIFKRRVGAGFSGHSARVGNTVEQLEADVPLPKIMHSGRWKSPVMVSRYGKETSAQNSGSAQLARKQGRG